MIATDALRPVASAAVEKTAKKFNELGREINKHGAEINQLKGRIDHDFIFPTIERFPAANPFVILNRRADGAVRMEAPGFGPSSSGGGMSNFAQLMAMGAAMDEKKEGEAAPELPQLEGTLTLTTDGAILANNTDEGPAPTTTGQKLEWKITPRSTAAPTALVKLGG